MPPAAGAGTGPRWLAAERDHRAAAGVQLPPRTASWRSASSSLPPRRSRSPGPVGARPRRSALTGPGGLTPAEHRVAQLAAQGHGNRAITERLYVTQRTVETDLTHAFQKLDITSRAELAAALEPEAAVASPGAGWLTDRTAASADGRMAARAPGTPAVRWLPPQHRQLDRDLGACARRAGNPDRPAQRLDPVSQADQP
jgi:DNA-binding CsgD family transcriptional regulator